jgi:cytochrome c-type biogenesis protein CcmH/NrfG
MLFVALAGNFKNSQMAQNTPAQAPTDMPAGMEGAIGALMQRVAKDPNDLNQLVTLVEALMAAGNWDAAETFARRGITLDTRDHRPLYLLGVVQHNKGRHQEAAETFKKGLAVKSNAPMHYSLGVLYTYFLNEPRHGLEHFTSALDAPDVTEDLKQAIGRELDKASRGQQSPETQGDKKSPAPRFPVGNTQPPSRETARQIAEAEKAVLRTPKDAAAWTELGNLYFDAGKAREAVSAYEQSLQLAPDNPDVLTDLGIMHRETGDFAKAVECFRKAASLNPRHENAFFNMGVVFHYDLRQTENAERAWRQLLQINPDARAPDGQPVSELIKHLH